MQCFGWVAVVLVFSLFAASPNALGQTRGALVIGNSVYQHAPRLANPRNDASDMAAALKKHGFQVIEGFDLNKTEFERKVRDFSAALRGAEAGVFFYAGHGLQVAGQNYLVPVDAKAETADALDWEMLRLDLVHRTMERATNTNILFLDACRDNPLARNLARAMGTRSSDIPRGLAAVESGVGTLISFSTQPGNVALDGTGRNSPFAGALVRRMSTSGDDLSALLIDVRNDVRKETQNKQIPWEHSALTGRFYFQARPNLAEVAPGSSEAERAWASSKDTTSIPLLEAFLRRFGDTYYGDLAKLRLAELQRAKEADVKEAAPLRSFEVRYGTEVNGTLHRSVESTTIEGCAKECVFDQACKGFKYRMTASGPGPFAVQAGHCVLYAAIKGTAPSPDLVAAIRR